MKTRDSTPSRPAEAVPLEGVIQFGYELRSRAAADRLDPALHRALEASRLRLRESRLIGRDPRRYGGLAFGNLSARECAGSDRFYITASQMTDADALSPEHWPRIDAFDMTRFFALVTGEHAPSSESVTHAVIYAAAGDIGCVLHVHSPEIWRHGSRLGLAATGRHTAYGSRQLAREVEALLAQRTGAELTFTTPGHEDGVFACGRGIEATTQSLLRLQQRAFRETT